MRNLLLISLSAWLLASCSPLRDFPENDAHPLFDTEKTSRYRLLIRVKQAEITGIMVLKYTAGEWRGSLMNEFGVKTFDWVASKGKCRLQNVLPFLDKWYIRRTIASDLTFLLGDAGRGKPVKGKSLEPFPDGGFLLKNEKRHIEYLFQPVEK
ncbi:MAG: hypothetical protein LBH61_06255 [Dysgonamonadaceae bacterium]|jgi:hypothetical protein|nr:hypothetical protein [Dysgonamonadaceae bacterium]